MISPKIRLQIQAVKSVLLNDATLPSCEGLEFEEFEESLWFHSIRPILFQFFRNNEKNLAIPDDLRKNLAAFVQNQTFISLNYAHEVGRLLKIFKEKKITVLPYKGGLFINELYGNRQLRELGDMDFLFHPDSAAEGMRILLNEGYQFDAIDKSFEKLPHEELIALTLNAKGQYEISFEKEDLHIDFHWGLYSGYLPFEIPLEPLFETAVEKDFYGINCLVPSPEATFWMLLLHHGGKENWTRVKHFADLIAFLKRFENELNWNEIIATSKAYKLHKQLIVGFRLLKKHFDYTPTKAIDNELLSYEPTEKVEQLIEAFWNKSQYWATLFPRLRMERIFVNLQDEGFLKRHYFREFYKMYVTPNPLEQPRIFNFSENYPTLNFISKVITYLVRRFR